jgi:hypothetical protein
VLDDQHGNVLRDVLDEVRDALAFGGGKTGQGLVKQQHLRFRAERNAEIDQPLPAIGEIAAFDVLDAFEAEESCKFRGLGMDGGEVINVTPYVEAAGRARLQRQAKGP